MTATVDGVDLELRGANEPWEVLACNGPPVPLHPTASGDAVEGVRFKAWAPWSSLHPSIDVQSPLTFDLVDLSVGHSLDGFRHQRSVPRPAGHTTVGGTPRSNEDCVAQSL